MIIAAYYKPFPIFEILGNTVIVVEHDEEAILIADHVIDIGPGAGVHGGQIVAEGTYDEVVKN